MPDWLKRFFGGTASAAPASGSHPPDASTAGVPDGLASITEATPYRFRTWLADSGRRDEASRVLVRELGHELRATAADEPDGRARLDVVSTFKGWAAVSRPLSVLLRHGIHVRGLEYVDLVRDLPTSDLEQFVRVLNAGPYDPATRRRSDALAGIGTILHAIAMQRVEPKVSAWRMVAGSAAIRTPGSLEIMLDAAVAEADPRIAAAYAGTAAAIGRMAALTGDPFEPRPHVLLELAKRRGDVGEAAHEAAQFVAAPLPDDLAEVLCKVARRGALSSRNAVVALRRARRTDEIVGALESALASTVLDVSDAALGSLAELLGTGARPYWQAGLSSTSAPRRMAAEDVIGQSGDARDVPLAAEHLRKIIRRKSSITWQPPRGSDIIGLLVRHRDMPEAQAALADLTTRWPKLPGELQQWLAQHHPDLVPADAAGVLGEGGIEGSEQVPDPDPKERAEPPLDWPPPTIERKGSELHLGFWDTDVTDIRDRFEDLCVAHPSVTILDGDREWSTLRIDAADPEALISELWARAHDRAAQAGTSP